MEHTFDSAAEELQNNLPETRSPSTGVNATLRILDLLASRGTLSLADVTRELGIAKSTAHRISAILVERGWAVRDGEGRFALGIRALRLGSSSSDLPIVTAFRTVAAEFLTRHDETILLAVLDGVESLFIALEETSQPVRLVTHVGSKTPAFASASGRVVLASHSPASVSALFGGQLLVTPTGRRLNGVAELQSLLTEVRAAGVRGELGGDGRRALRGLRPDRQRGRGHARSADDVHPDLADHARASRGESWPISSGSGPRSRSSSAGCRRSRRGCRDAPGTCHR